MADRPRRLQDRTRAVASRSSGRHDGSRLCPLIGLVKPALPVPESRERSHARAARADLVPQLVALNDASAAWRCWVYAPFATSRSPNPRAPIAKDHCQRNQDLHNADNALQDDLLV